MFIAALFTIAKTWKQLECQSRNEWIKKMWSIHTKEYFISLKKEILTHATTWIRLEDTMLSEISSKSQILYDSTYMRYLKSNS